METPVGETLACLIIDDPLLRPQYGFVNYTAMLREMRRHRFFTEIAFIPYNWNKSDPATVRLFKDNPDCLAICVHGCNHQHSEFATGSYEQLDELAATSLRLMERHRQLTGLDYDPVMVFPHGRFSATALRALANNGYLAAFNSTLKPHHGEAPPEAEFDRPATRHFHDFPLFLRHYPEDREAFKRDIATGRPLIVVQHHNDFRNAYEDFTQFVDWLNGLGNLRWTNLQEIARHYAGEQSAEMDARRRTIVQQPLQRRRELKVWAQRTLSEFRDNYVHTRAGLRAKPTAVSDKETAPGN